MARKVRDFTTCVGCPYDNGDIKGRVKSINTEESTAVIETLNEEGDIEDVIVDISDSFKFRKYIKDSAAMDAYWAASRNIDENDIFDLYNDGEIWVHVPEELDSSDYAEAALEWVRDIWGDPSVGIDFEDVDLDYEIEGNNLHITIV